MHDSRDWKWTSIHAMEYAKVGEKETWREEKYVTNEEKKKRNICFVVGWPIDCLFQMFHLFSSI